MSYSFDNRSIKRIAIACLALFFLFYFLLAFGNRHRLMALYTQGISAIEEGNYSGGINILEDLGSYQNGPTYIEIAKRFETLLSVKSKIESEEFEAALEILNQMRILNDAIITEDQGINDLLVEFNIQIEEYYAQIDTLQTLQRLYNLALEYYYADNYIQAKALFDQTEGYRDSDDLAKNCDNFISILKYSTTISAGVTSSAGVTCDGHVYLVDKRVIDPSEVEDWRNIVSVSVWGSLIVGLKLDGTVVTAGHLDNNYRIETSNWNDIIAVSAGDLYIVGLRENGTLVAQGYNNYGQMNIDTWENIIAISTGWRLTAALAENGNIYVAGYNKSQIESQIENNKDDWTDIVAISAGGGQADTKGEHGHIVALKSDGTVVAAGDNERGQCNVSPDDGWTDIIAISAGAYHTVGLKSDGTVVTTQTSSAFPNSYKEISSWTDIVAISAGYGFTLGLKSDGTLVGAGYDLDGQRDTEDWENIAIRDEWNCIFDIT